ncbi:MAG: hypothetical protein V4642_00895 [Bacteroidota bacterium]
MRFIIRLATLICFAVLVNSCSVTQPVRVLKENQTTIDGSLGGAFIPLGESKVPVPYLIAGASHGYSENLTLSSHLHITPFTTTVLGLDAGAAMCFLKQAGAIPEVTAKGQFYAFTDFKSLENMRFFPIITLNGSWLVGETTLLYLGADNTFQLSDPNYIVSPFLGTQFDLSNSLRMNVEGKWMAANINTEQNVFDGKTSAGGQGGYGIFLGLSYNWK